MPSGSTRKRRRGISKDSCSIRASTSNKCNIQQRSNRQQAFYASGTNSFEVDLQEEQAIELLEASVVKFLALHPPDISFKEVMGDILIKINRC